MSEISIEVKDVTKTFRIYHEKRNSVFEALVGWFNKKKYYEDLQILQNINFTIKKGEMFGIIGRNGAGKTTLLRIISGIYKPDTGTVRVNGLLIPLLGLGIGFQLDLTAKTNVVQYGILLGFKKKQILERVDQIMEFAELEKFADTKLKNFSSGMYSRLAFSTAVQVDPDILILDEILYAGDLSFQQKAFDAIISFKKRGKSILLVTHDMRPVQDQCDRAMFLNNGKSELVGTPRDVIEAYTKSLHLK
ncbi:O-antigen export system ATP-binding protein RfbB (fragment) [Nitrosotalea sinensis]|uniref:O-antigen export system ATP-binding protein RfbB n=1 Tax=Nitrosotalea sinensis TaxID=1499975 RepID=A0A2H1EF40_9ARCH